MTKPTIKLSSHSLSQVTRPKAESPINKKPNLTSTEQKIYSVSKNTGNSPLHIHTMLKQHIKNAPSLGDLAEAASTRIEQASNKLNSVLNDLDSLNIYPGQEVADVFKTYQSHYLRIVLVKN